MNDEIKEILIFIENKIYPKGSLLFEKWSSLKDYIINLQQELETRQYDINNLTYQLAKEKSRIEKAVEYIKNDDNFWVALGEDCGKPNDDLDKLLNILEGEEKENG